MEQPIEALTRQFLDWVSGKPRTYAETIDAWRTSCPRLTVWEDAFDKGLVAIDRRQVVLTPEGEAFLAGGYARKKNSMA